MFKKPMYPPFSFDTLFVHHNDYSKRSLSKLSKSTRKTIQKKKKKFREMGVEVIEI